MNIIFLEVILLFTVSTEEDILCVDGVCMTGDGVAGPSSPTRTAVSADAPVPPISKPGAKSPADDVSVITIRQILKSVASSL